MTEAQRARIARKNGLRTYRGNACRHHGPTTRYASNAACIHCQQQASRDDRARGARTRRRDDCKAALAWLRARGIQQPTEGQVRAAVRLVQHARRQQRTSMRDQVRAAQQAAITERLAIGLNVDGTVSTTVETETGL